MKKLITQKIHFAYALFLIFTLSVIPISILTVLFLYQVPIAEALLTPGGFEVLPPGPLKCVLNNIDGDCLASCPICGDVASCNGIWEVKVRPLNTQARAALYKGQALCLAPQDIRPPKGGTFRVRSKCIGRVFSAGILHKLINFGCYR